MQWNTLRLPGCNLSLADVRLIKAEAEHQCKGSATLVPRPARLVVGKGCAGSSGDRPEVVLLVAKGQECVAGMVAVTPDCAFDLLLVEPLLSEPLQLTGGFVTAQYPGNADQVTAYACKAVRATAQKPTGTGTGGFLWADLQP